MQRFWSLAHFKLFVKNFFQVFSNFFRSSFEAFFTWPKSHSNKLRSTWMCYARRQRSSWARIKLSKYLYQFVPWHVSIFLFRAMISSFLLCLSIYSSRINEIFHTRFTCFVLVSLVVRFSMTVRCSRRSLAATACILYHTPYLLVKHFFLLFLFFFVFRVFHINFATYFYQCIEKQHKSPWFIRLFSI